MCTHLRIPGSGSPVVTARSMDFSEVMPYDVCWIPDNMAFPRIAVVPNAVQWSTSVAFVAVTAGLGGVAAPWYTDGLSAEGVSFSAQWLPGTTYAEPAPSGNLSIGDVGSFILGQATGADFKHLQGLFDGITVVGDVKKYPLHFIVADAEGNCSVIEFIDGQMQISDVADGVMTNAPEYDWHLKNAYNYENLTPHNNPALYPPEGTSSYTQPINGSGMQGLPGDATPPSRYIRAATMVKSVYRPHKHFLWPDGDVQQNAVTFALELLRTCMVPRGTAVNEDFLKDELLVPQGDFTQWHVVRDHSNLCYYFASVLNPTLRKIDLRKLSGAKPLGIPLAQPDWYADVSSDMKPLKIL